MSKSAATIQSHHERYAERNVVRHGHTSGLTVGPKIRRDVYTGLPADASTMLQKCNGSPSPTPWSRFESLRRLDSLPDHVPEGHHRMIRHGMEGGGGRGRSGGYGGVSPD